MVSISTGTYSVSKSVKSVLRTNLDTTLASLAGEGVSDYLPPDLQVGGSNMYLSDERNPPQAKSWILGQITRAEEYLSLTAGTSNSRFELMLRCGVRQFRKNAATSDPAPFVSDAGWQVSGLLAQASAYTLRRYLAAESSIYNLAFRGSRNLPPDPQTPNVYQVESRFWIYSRTNDPFLE